MAINLLAAKIAACTLATLVLVPFGSSLLDSIWLLGTDGENIDVVESKEGAIEHVVAMVTPKVIDGTTLEVRGIEIFPSSPYPIIEGLFN